VRTARSGLCPRTRPARSASLDPVERELSDLRKRFGDQEAELSELRKELQERPGRDLALLGRALESAAFGVGITDLEGRMLYANQAVLRMWGFERKAELIGRPLLDFWEGDGILETLAALSVGVSRSGEDTGRRQDGSLFPVQFSASVVMDDQGDPCAPSAHS